jgi:hypothetical protein
MMQFSVTCKKTKTDWWQEFRLDVLTYISATPVKTSLPRVMPEDSDSHFPPHSNGITMLEEKVMVKVKIMVEVKVK